MKLVFQATLTIWSLLLPISVTMEVSAIPEQANLPAQGQHWNKQLSRYFYNVCICFHSYPNSELLLQKGTSSKWSVIKRHLERHHTWLYDELIIHRYIRRILQKSVASQAYSVLRICTKLLQQPNKKSKEPKLVMFLGFRTKCIHFKHGQQNALPFGLAIQNPFEKVGNKQCSRTLIFLLSGLRRFDVLVSNSPPHPATVCSAGKRNPWSAEQYTQQSRGQPTWHCQAPAGYKQTITPTSPPRLISMEAPATSRGFISQCFVFIFCHANFNNALLSI